MSRPVAFVTGASSGIGESLALEFARRGYDLAICARRVDRLQAVAAASEKLGAAALALSCDVTQDADVEKAFAAAAQKFGRIDVVVANAGFSLVGKVEKFALDGYRRVFETNIFGVIRTAKAAIPHLRATRGSFAVTGSVMGYVSTPGASAYCMSKFAVTSFAEAFRHEVARDGISVTLVSPGFIATEIRAIGKDGKLIEGFVDPVPKYLNMPSVTAARIITRDIIRRRRDSVVTLHAKLAICLARHFPKVLRFFIGISTNYNNQMLRKIEHT